MKYLHKPTTVTVRIISNIARSTNTTTIPARAPATTDKLLVSVNV